MVDFGNLCRWIRLEAGYCQRRDLTPEQRRRQHVPAGETRGLYLAMLRSLPWEREFFRQDDKR